MQWFRMYGEFANDPKVQMLSEVNQRRLVMLFCFRCNGNVTLHDEEVTFQLRISHAEWMETKAEFVRRGFIDNENNIMNWNKRQFISDDSNQRVKRHREKMKRACNVTVTPPDTDTDTDTEEESKKAATEKIDFDFSTGHFSGITEAKRTLWRQAYPAVNQDAEINRAAAWLIENPKNKKSNYGKFLTNWLSRTQDRAPKAEGDFKKRNRMPSPAGG